MQNQPKPQQINHTKNNQQNTTNKTHNKQTVLQLFQKSNPLSVNNKSIYRQDYQSLIDHNWLKTQAISSLITLLENKFIAHINQLLQTQLKNIPKSLQQLQKVKQTFKNYVKIIDPFIVTMILSTQQQVILQTLEGLDIFNSKNKYILFPMNTDHAKGNHWYLTILTNPRYQSLTDKTKPQQPQLFILNSIPSSKHDTSVYMTNELSQQIIRLLAMFHPSENKLTQIPVHRIQNITHQSNSYDCGIFTIAYVEEFLFSIVFEKEIEHIVKLGLWEKSLDQEKYEGKTLSSKSQFLIVKSSTFLRKHYRETLQNQIVSQNLSLLQ